MQENTFFEVSFLTKLFYCEDYEVIKIFYRAPPVGASLCGLKVQSCYLISDGNPWQPFAISFPGGNIKGSSKWHPIFRGSFLFFILCHATSWGCTSPSISPNFPPLSVIDYVRPIVTKRNEIFKLHENLHFKTPYIFIFSYILCIYIYSFVIFYHFMLIYICIIFAYLIFGL